MLILSFILMVAATLLSGLWFLSSLLGWMMSNVVVSLGYPQFIGPSAHNKRIIESLLRTRRNFEDFWFGGLCRFAFCAIVSMGLYRVIWG